MSDTWGAIRSNACGLAKWAKFQGPGHWNDEDMLVVGRVSLGDRMHPSHLTANEQYLHISQWCLLGSPLLIGCDLEHLDPFTLNLLTNDEVLDVDQDPLGVMAHPVRQTDAEEVWAKPLEDGTVAVGLFNVSEEPRDISVSWSDLGLHGRQIIRDLWRQRYLRPSSTGYRARVPRHGVVLLKLSPAR
jgi:alpha-galactosidase